MRRDSRAAGHAPAPDRGGPRRRLSIRFAAWMRWLHVYLSMFGLGAVLFFSLTGITLNHPDWFYEEASRQMQTKGRLDAHWLRRAAADSSPGAEPDRAGEVARLEVVEHLRSAHGVRGALADFRVDDAECQVSFKGPGYAADVYIDRNSGRYELNESYHGLIAVLNDLHKGRDTGRGWSLVIDASAVVMTFVSLTGLVLLFYLKRRRMPGMAVGVLGAAVVVAAFLLLVP